MKQTVVYFLFIYKKNTTGVKQAFNIDVKLKTFFLGLYAKTGGLVPRAVHAIFSNRPGDSIDGIRRIAEHCIVLHESVQSQTPGKDWEGEGENEHEHVPV